MFKDDFLSKNYAIYYNIKGYFHSNLYNLMIFRHCPAMFVQYWTNKYSFIKIKNKMYSYVFKVTFDFSSI